ncbi:MAG TPA: flippase [Gaiellaceae bacterium]|nr:flippase [Gaiellaceae bacterium]
MAAYPGVTAAPVVAERESTKTQIRGSSLLLAGRFLSMAANFVIQVLIVRYLSKTDYGAFAYALAIVTLAESVAILGLDRAAGRFLPIYDEQKQTGRVLGTIALVIGTIVSLGLTLVLLVFGLQGVLSGTVVGDEQAMTLLLIMIVLGPIQALDHLLIGIFAVYANARAIFFRKYVLGPGLRLAVVLMLVLGEAGVSFLAAGYVAAGALGVAIYTGILVRTLRERDVLTRANLREISIPYREIFSFAGPLLAIDLVFVMMNTTDAILLEHFRSAAEVAEFRVIRPAAHLNLLVMSSFALLFTPIASRLFARQDREGLRDLYWQTATWIAVLTFPIFALTFALAEPVTVGLFEERYRDSAVYLSLLAVGYYFNAALGFNGLTLRVFGLVRYIVVISLLAAAFNLAINLILIPRYGAVGAAIGTCLTLVLHNVLKQAGLRRGTGIRAFDWRTLRVYLVIAAGAAALFAVQRALHPGVIAALLLALVVSAIVVALTRSSLRIGETFPELLKFRILERVFR